MSPDDRPATIEAPWTPEQVAALNAFQARSNIHPFTCGKCGGLEVLVATSTGWLCPKDCGYSQTWAWESMATEGGWPVAWPHAERAGREGDSQPLPLPNDRPAIQDLVIADILKRKELGIRRYGTPLQAGNGRNALLDAYEEALDLAVYLRQALEERKGNAT